MVRTAAQHPRDHVGLATNLLTQRTRGLRARNGRCTGQLVPLWRKGQLVSLCSLMTLFGRGNDNHAGLPQRSDQRAKSVRF